MAGSSQELEPDELASLLARKATEDAVALREFAANAEIADTVLGFHAQQAIEKWLKAVLARHAVNFEYTHDLRHLIGLIEDARIDFPFDTPTVVRLTEYAVPLRHGRAIGRGLPRPGRCRKTRQRSRRLGERRARRV
jgi:HEPN domain-containing protein